ncbi:MAG TPA: hypothetical protein VIF83_07975 [Gemmatimonadaceae bacterium]|jgi:hypothetical protein
MNMRRKLIEWCCTISISIVTIHTSSFAAQNSYVVQQSTFNKLADAIGSFSGAVGPYEFAIWTPCFPDFWNQCRVVVYHYTLNWTLSNPSFSITQSGVRFSGNLRTSFGPFPFSTTVSGPVTISYAAPNFHVSISQVSVPVTVNLPIYGAWTITTLTINPNYGFTFPISTMYLPVTTPAGSRFVRALPRSASLAYEPGAVRINADIAVW